jgi:hypothetical protein
MHRRLTALILVLVASGSVSACGGGEETGDVVPRETPELALPGDGSTTLPAAAADTSTTADTTTTDTSTTADGTATPAPTPQTPATATPQTPATNSGGTAAPQTTTPATGGTADPGGFSDFCTQNPGACDN